MLRSVRLIIGEAEHRVRHPAPEPLVVHELLEQLGIVLEHGGSPSSLDHHRTHGKHTLDAGSFSQAEVVSGLPIRWGCYGPPHAFLGLLLAIVSNSAIRLEIEV